MEVVRSYKAKAEGVRSKKAAVISYLPFSLAFSRHTKNLSLTKDFIRGFPAVRKMKYRHIQIDRISALCVQSI